MRFRNIFRHITASQIGESADGGQLFPVLHLLSQRRDRGVVFGRPRTLDGRTAEIMKLKKAGQGLRAIARQLSMPVSSVHSVLKSSNKSTARRSGRKKVSR